MAMTFDFMLRIYLSMYDVVYMTACLYLKYGRGWTVMPFAGNAAMTLASAAVSLWCLRVRGVRRRTVIALFCDVLNFLFSLIALVSFLAKRHAMAKMFTDLLSAWILTCLLMERRARWFGNVDA